MAVRGRWRLRVSRRAHKQALMRQEHGAATARVCGSLRTRQLAFCLTPAWLSLPTRCHSRPSLASTPRRKLFCVT